MKVIFTDGPKYNLSEAQQYAQTYPWSRCMDHMEITLQSLVNDNGELSDFKPDIELENAVFIHCEPRVITSNLTRAREIRIAGFRSALQQNYSLQEIFASPLNRRKHRKVIQAVLLSAKPKFIYFEGTSSMLSLFSRRYNELKVVLNIAKNKGIPLVYYLPDAHEYWDDYVISTGSATSVHLARYRKRKLLKLISKFNATIAYPSEEFRNALFNKVDSKLSQALKGVDSIVLPPAASLSNEFHKPKQNLVRYIYAGGIGPFYKLHRFLIAINQKPLGIGIEFYIRIRDLGALDTQYKSLMSNSSIDVRHGSLPKEITGCLPVGILLLEPIDYISVAVPLKFYSYLERGWPILCYEGTAIGNIVSEFGLGWCIKCDVGSVLGFINSDLATRDYDNIQTNIKTYLKKNTWLDRVEKIVGVSE